MKKNIYIIILLFLIKLNAQSINENNKINLGFGLSKSNYSSDLASWKNSISPELFIGLKWSPKIEYIIFLNFTNFESNINISSKKILIAAGLNFTIIEYSILQFKTFAILTNSTFIFQDNTNNNIESEFGGGIGTELRIKLSESVKFSAKYYIKNIFTNPINTIGQNFGASILLEL